VPADDSPLDIVRTSVRTDPGLALRTRKGTGFTPPGQPKRAIRGHEFGLELAPE